MAAITITTNIDAVLAKILGAADKLKDKDFLLRPVAQETIVNMKDRIHIEGEDSKETQIGTYSSGYMKLRTGNYGNAKRNKKGFVTSPGKVTKKKVQLYGTTKSVFADVSTMNINRKKYGRSSDPKVVVSLTRQLENDWAVLATQKGYGIGFNNPFNTKKARWVEETYDKKIFNLTPTEQEYILDRLNELTINALDS